MIYSLESFHHNKPKRGTKTGNCTVVSHQKYKRTLHSRFYLTFYISPMYRQHNKKTSTTISFVTTNDPQVFGDVFN